MMLFKHHVCRRPCIPQARYRVTNPLGALLRSSLGALLRSWPYEAGLRRRGDRTLWGEQAALAGWQAPRRSTLGGPPRCSALATGLVPTPRLVFRLALRQAEGVARSVLPLPGMALPVPGHSPLSRRGRAFAGRQPRVTAGPGPVRLVLDSAGLELSGAGEWCAAKHGRLRRRWLKLPLGMDASTGEIAAHVLTDGNGDNAAQAPALLRQRGRRLRPRSRLPGRRCPTARVTARGGHRTPGRRRAGHG